MNCDKSLQTNCDCLIIKLSSMTISGCWSDDGTRVWEQLVSGLDYQLHSLLHCSQQDNKININLQLNEYCYRYTVSVASEWKRVKRCLLWRVPWYPMTFNFTVSRIYVHDFSDSVRARRQRVRSDYYACISILLIIYIILTDKSTEIKISSNVANRPLLRLWKVLLHPKLGKAS